MMSSEKKNKLNIIILTLKKIKDLSLSISGDKFPGGLVHLRRLPLEKQQKRQGIFNLNIFPLDLWASE